MMLHPLPNPRPQPQRQRFPHEIALIRRFSVSISSYALAFEDVITRLAREISTHQGHEVRVGLQSSIHKINASKA